MFFIPDAGRLDWPQNVWSRAQNDKSVAQSVMCSYATDKVIVMSNAKHLPAHYCWIFIGRPPLRDDRRYLRGVPLRGEVQGIQQ